MKRSFTICVCFLMCLALCSCNAAGTRSISSYNWSLESISGMDGEILFSGSEHDGVEALDMALSFDKNGFTLTDHTNQQEWTGTYSLEKVGDSSKLVLTCDELENPAIGIFGTRTYDNNSKIATITLQTDEYILSFIGNE